MADKTKKLEKNITGQYYVDSECIGCGMCHEVAPEYFMLDDANGTAYVGKQPADDSAKSQCEEALTSCPVEAIGNDG